MWKSEFKKHDVEARTSFREYALNRTITQHTNQKPSSLGYCRNTSENMSLLQRNKENITRHHSVLTGVLNRKPSNVFPQSIRHLVGLQLCSPECQSRRKDGIALCCTPKAHSLNFALRPLARTPLCQKPPVKPMVFLWIQKTRLQKARPEMAVTLKNVLCKLQHALLARNEADCSAWWTNKGFQNYGWEQFRFKLAIV